MRRVPAVRLSVVVCTLDRADLLAGCLEALAADLPDDGSVEVVVVDNGSTDHTAAVVAASGAARLVQEPERGLARARNAGLQAAHSDLVAFLDDDARPELGWSDALLRAADRWPTAAAIGGPVRIEMTVPEPRWLVPDLTHWYSAVDHGDLPRLLDHGELPVGANLAVARQQAIDLGGFAPELGRVGTSLASEEEVDLLRRLRRAGGTIGWEPQAAVRHVVGADRVTRRWIVRRAWAQGRSDARVAELEGVPHRRDLRLALRTVTRGWPTTVGRIRRAPVPAGAAVVEVARRARRLARALDG